MNQTSRDVPYHFVHLYPVPTQNYIYSITFQDDESGREHSPDKLEYGGTLVALGNVNGELASMGAHHLPKITCIIRYGKMMAAICKKNTKEETDVKQN
jgi:hypothetical protein